MAHVSTRSRLVLVALATSVLLCACDRRIVISSPSPPAAPVSSKPRILIIGDSISSGMLGDYTWRYRLWQDFRASGTAVEFVGPRTGTEDIYDDPSDLATAAGQRRPADNYADPTDGYYSRSIPAGPFPGPGASNHDALWGWSYRGAIRHIAQDVQTYQPGYLLIELGFNDLAYGSPAETLADAKTVIRVAQSADPHVEILIANVPHQSGQTNLDANIDDYNLELEGAAQAWSTASSSVHVVDITTGYDPTVDSYDGLHPNGLGEYEIADAFATALADDYDLGAAPGQPPRSVPGIALARPGSLSAKITTFGGSSGPLLQWSHVYGAGAYRILYRDVTGNPAPSPRFAWLPTYLPIAADHWYPGGALPGHTYQYEVVAVRGSQQSSPSSPVTITVPS